MGKGEVCLWVVDPCPKPRRYPNLFCPFTRRKKHFYITHTQLRPSVGLSLFCFLFCDFSFECKMSSKGRITNENLTSCVSFCFKLVGQILLMVDENQLADSLSFSFVFLWIRIEFLSVWKWISFRTMVWYGERNQSCSVLFFFFYVLYFLLGGAGIDRQYQISNDVKRNSKKKKLHV